MHVLLQMITLPQTHTTSQRGPKVGIEAFDFRRGTKEAVSTGKGCNERRQGSGENAMTSQFCQPFQKIKRCVH
jgi:hypothetical protein